MKQRNFKRAIGILLLAAMIVGCLAGCSGKGKEESNSANTEKDGTQEEGKEDKGQAMGRFLEEEVKLPTDFGNIYDMKRLEDGTIRLIGSDGNGKKNAWDSKDSGASWEKAFDFPTELQDEEKGYIDYAALSTGGQAICVWNEIGDNGISPVLYLMDEKGNGSRLEYEFPKKEGDSNLLLGIQFLGTDQILVKDMKDNVYQINIQDGSIKRTYEFDGTQESHQMFAVGKRLMVQTSSEALLYDTETGEQQKAEEALQKNVLENGMFNAIDTTDAGESVYYLSKGGLYHYKFGGSVMEHLIDGTMNSLGAPSFYAIALTMIDDQNLLVAANDINAESPGGIEILKYTYSADTPSKPEKELKVYSLNDNRELRQSISRFQKEHTDVYVNYQIALSEENGVTVSDALKTLTTEIMAGKGPDVLVLDGMPVDTYIKKGILKDLSSVLDLSEKDYFNNILNAYKKEKNGLCAVPARFMIPMIQAGSAYYTPGEDFDSFTQRKEALAHMKPKLVVEKFWYSCGAAWQKDDKTLDASKITDFLTKLKNAYGEYDSSIEEGKTGVYISSEDAEIQEMRKLSLDWGSFDVAFGRTNTCVGLCGSMDYGMWRAVNEKLENGTVDLMPGQADRSFVPCMILGVSSKSTQTQTAEQFVSYLFSNKAQKISQFGGFPVEKEAFRSVIDGHEYEGKESLVSTGGVGLDEKLSYAMEPTPEEEVKKMIDIAESLKTPALCDDVIKDAVTEQGEKVLKGELDPQEATDAIMQKVNIYLAE